MNIHSFALYSGHTHALLAFFPSHSIIVWSKFCPFSNTITPQKTSSCEIGIFDKDHDGSILAL